jgi:hypothetical protein
MIRIHVIAGVLSAIFAGVAAPAAAQDADLTGVLVLNGKGYALGQAEVTIRIRRGDKEQEPARLALTVCAEAAASLEDRCKMAPDDIPASRVSSFEHQVTADAELIGWEVLLSLVTDGDGALKPCYAAGTTLPAQVSCGPTPDKQAVRFQLTGGAQ